MSEYEIEVFNKTFTNTRLKALQIPSKHQPVFQKQANNNI